MKALVQSPRPIAPAAIYENVIFFREGMHLHFDLEAPTAAHFTIERLEPMTAGEVLAFTAGRVRRPGLYVRAVNRSAEPRIFRAQAMTTPDPAALQAPSSERPKMLGRAAAMPSTRTTFVVCSKRSVDEIRELERKGISMIDRERAVLAERLTRALEDAFEQASQGRRPTHAQIDACVASLVEVAAATTPVKPRRPRKPENASSDSSEPGSRQ